MAVETNRDAETGQFKAPPPGAVTQEDAEALERGDKTEHPRIAMMKAAREKRAAEMGAEVEGDASTEKPEPNNAVFPGEGGEGTNTAAETEDDAGGTSTGTDTGTATATSTAATASDDMIVELQVNGESKKMTLKDAKKHLQLGLATKETLDQAKKTRDEANAELLAARAVRTVVGEGTATVTAEPTAAEKAAKALETAEAARENAFAAYTKAVRHGDEEEVETAAKDLRTAEKALDKAKDDARAPVGSPAGGDALLERETADTNRAIKDYAETFKADQDDKLFRAAASANLREEIVADLTKLGADENILAKLTDAELGEHHLRARSRGLVRTLDKVLTAAGTNAREELKRRAGAGTPPANPRQERETSKLNAPTAPKIAAGRMPEPQGEQPKTAKDLIAEARQRRGKA